jgi:histidyl-tRNA synthetase
MIDITIAIDKLDKIGIEKVKQELQEKNIEQPHIDIIEKYLSISGTNEEKLSQIKSLLGNSSDTTTGINELQFIINKSKHTSINLSIDFTLARGLNYYTGIIFEAKAPANVQIGSIGGGGRYDDLTGLFGVPNVPGVGISFGVDRIYDVLEELKLFPEEISVSTTVLFFNEGNTDAVSHLAHILRHRNISCEVYPDADKEDKQFKYAKRKNIPYIVSLNSDRINYKVKNIVTGKSHILHVESLAEFEFA